MIVLLIGLEMYGRQATTDIHDTIGAIVLLLIMATIALRHRNNPTSWVKRLGWLVWRLAKLTDFVKLSFGPDLRGSPQIPRKMPLGYHLLLASLAAWCILGTLAWYYFPSGWRPPVVQVSYIAYLFLLSLLWGAMFLTCLAGVYLPTMVVSRLFPQTEGTPYNRRRLIAIASYISSISILSWLFPLWIPLTVNALFWLGALVVQFTLGFGNSNMQLIWRAYRSQKIFAITLPRLLLACTSVAIFGLFALTISASGSYLYGKPKAEQVMGLTNMLGTWVAWLSPGMFLSSFILAWYAWIRSPSGKEIRFIDLENGSEPTRNHFARLVRPHGWHLATPVTETDYCTIHVRIVHPEASQATEFDPKWPLELCLEDLKNADVHFRLKRRYELQARRKFLRCTEVLFKQAKSVPRNGAEGYWFAPHLWFVGGLTRDEAISSEDEMAFLAEMIGPPYRELYPLSVRKYFYHLLRAMEIDVIFIEIGIGAGPIIRIFRRLFEVYDRTHPARRAEDLDFRQMIKYRVMFHDLDVEQKKSESKYYEPKFAPLGRLRIMHIYRDKGGEEELQDSPFSSDSSPVPLALA
ncbi:MAG: hypothetical protein R3B84_05665 [Zavarzinella sp.]